MLCRTRLPSTTRPRTDGLLSARTPAPPFPLIPRPLCACLPSHRTLQLCKPQPAVDVSLHPAIVVHMMLQPATPRYSSLEPCRGMPLPGGAATCSWRLTQGVPGPLPVAGSHHLGHAPPETAGVALATNQGRPGCTAALSAWPPCLRGTNQGHSVPAWPPAAGIIARLGLQARVCVLDAEMIGLDRDERVLALSNGGQLSYDYLLITCGLQEQTATYLAQVRHGPPRLHARDPPPRGTHTQQACLHTTLCSRGALSRGTRSRSTHAPSPARQVHTPQRRSCTYAPQL